MNRQRIEEIRQRAEGMARDPYCDIRDLLSEIDRLRVERNADAKIVRCGQCVFYGGGYCSYHSDVKGKSEPMAMRIVDFCSRGEMRKELCEAIKASAGARDTEKESKL
jgi:hypothetical protein